MSVVRFSAFYGMKEFGYVCVCVYKGGVWLFNLSLIGWFCMDCSLLCSAFRFVCATGFHSDTRCSFLIAF